MADPAFSTSDGLNTALQLLASRNRESVDLPVTLPESGLGEMRTLDMLSGHVLDRAAQLGSPTALGYMDPPTPWTRHQPKQRRRVRASGLVDAARRRRRIGHARSGTEER